MKMTSQSKPDREIYQSESGAVFLGHPVHDPIHSTSIFIHHMIIQLICIYKVRDNLKEDKALQQTWTRKG